MTDTRKTPTGAELKAWRARLGLSEAWVETVLGAVKTQHHTPSPDCSVSRQQRRIVAEGGELRSGLPAYSHACVDAFRDAYAAALAAEEARVLYVLVGLREDDDPRYLKAREVAFGDFIMERLPLLHRAWWRLDNADVTEPLREAYRAILDALAEMVGEKPAADDARLRGAEPVPPEGVMTWTEQGDVLMCVQGAPVSVIRVASDGSMRTTGQGPASIDVLEHACALSRHLAAQHAAGEQNKQRKMSAVKTAQAEAVEATDRARQAVKDLTAAIAEAVEAVCRDANR